MSTLDIPKRFFFRFSFPCDYIAVSKESWSDLDESYRIPAFSDLEPSAVSSRLSVDFRIGWNEKSLRFSATVSGKQRLPWCKLTHAEESEGIQICLDTRDVRNVHRATRYCHRFAFFPLGHGPEGKDPAVLWFPIHRAKGHPNPVAIERIFIRSVLLKDGYRIDAILPADVLTGYDPLEHSRLGFHYFVVDKEFGDRPFLVGYPFPHDQDPSLWGTAECLRER